MKKPVSIGLMIVAGAALLWAGATFLVGVRVEKRLNDLVEEKGKLGIVNRNSIVAL